MGAGHGLAHEGATGSLYNLEALYYQPLVGAEIEEGPDSTPLTLIDTFNMHG